MELIVIVVGLATICHGDILSARVTLESDNPSLQTTHQYALDAQSTKQLALAEQDLVDSLNHHFDKISTIDKDDLCHIYLHKYLAEFVQDTRAVKGDKGLARATKVAENPILILKMLRRMLVTLLQDTLEHCTEKFPEVGKTVWKIFTGANLPLPTQQDLDDALLGLLRLHFIYGWNATRYIRLGILDGVITGAFLYFDDCLALGKKAVELDAEALAYQWLQSAPLSPPEYESPPEHLNKDMFDHETTMLQLLNLTMLGDWDKLHWSLRRKKQKKMDQVQHYNFYETCRDEITMSKEEQSQLFCFLQKDWDPYLYINPLKSELLSEDPVIIQFYDFVGPKTIEIIKQLKTQQKAKEPQPHPSLKTLNRRIEHVTGLHVHKKGASELQISEHSALGAFYDFENDALFETEPPPEIAKEGNRIATFLMFLNDVTKGGYTAFPDVGVFAKPIKGSAVIWYSLKLNGETDERPSHGGCPIVLGTKEVAVQFINQYENMFKHPCSLDPEE